MGFWTYVEPRFKTAVDLYNVSNRNGIRLVSRPAAGSPAQGSFKAYRATHEELITRAFEGLS